jgi:hypothetical protein
LGAAKALGLDALEALRADEVIKPSGNVRMWHEADLGDVCYSSACEAEADMSIITANLRF